MILSPQKITNLIIAFSLLLPGLFVVFLHYPIDEGFSLYNLCIGRYELNYDLADFTRPRRSGYWPCRGNDVSTPLARFWTYGCYTCHTMFFIIGNNVIEVIMEYRN